MFSRKKAQSTLEYALVIAAVVGALLAINVYMKKGVQGRLKASTDQIGKQFDPSGTYNSTWNSQTSGNTTTAESREKNTGTTTSNVTTAEAITKAETETWSSTNNQ